MTKRGQLTIYLGVGIALLIVLVAFILLWNTDTGCPEDARLCPDGTSVMRQAPDCEFAACPHPEGATFCQPNDRGLFCTAEYDPVCGWIDPGQADCETFPCTETKSNACTACADPTVVYWTPGECS
ncbi:hypothetical protein GF342_05445 [Candidatus Woesearchaeota archaeon]|nr:hypothetical protein [Candidatus Woesearchaeota archaeon]